MESAKIREAVMSANVAVALYQLAPKRHAEVWCPHCNVLCKYLHSYKSVKSKVGVVPILETSFWSLGKRATVLPRGVLCVVE